MVRLLPLFFCLFLLPVCGDEIFLQTELFAVKHSGAVQKSVDQLLKDPSAQCLFQSRFRGVPGADSSVSLYNFFGSRQSGFSVKLTPNHPAPRRNNRKIVSEINWHFAPEGPFLASGTEGFYEGTMISNTRFLLPETFSPLGVTQASSTDNLYIPAITYQVNRNPKTIPFLRKSKWKLTMKVTGEGGREQIFSCVPVYHHGRFPMRTEPGVMQARIYQHGDVTVLNAVSCRSLGKRNDGSEVTEQVSLSLCLKVPEHAQNYLIAELVSQCGSGDTAFGKMPASGGAKYRYQFFLSVK